MRTVWLTRDARGVTLRRLGWTPRSLWLAATMPLFASSTDDASWWCGLALGAAMTLALMPSRVGRVASAPTARWFPQRVDVVARSEAAGYRGEGAGEVDIDGVTRPLGDLRGVLTGAEGVEAVGRGVLAMFSTRLVALQFDGETVVVGRVVSLSASAASRDSYELARVLAEPAGLDPVELSDPPQSPSALAPSGTLSSTGRADLASLVGALLEASALPSAGTAVQRYGAHLSSARRAATVGVMMLGTAVACGASVWLSLWAHGSPPRSPWVAAAMTAAAWVAVDAAVLRLAAHLVRDAARRHARERFSLLRE